MAEFSFNCPFCNLELSIDESNVGQEVECPGCKEVLIIPTPDGGAVAEEERGPAIPQGSFPEAKIIKNAAKSLDIAAKTVAKHRVKSFRHHEHIKDGKDGFDDAVSNFIGGLKEDDILSLTGFQYTHQLKGKDAEGKETTTPVTEYGVLVHYKG
jgi:phage FluMu protein Com